ncbi:Phage tail X protein [Azotobacter vinelandii CA]|uniref:Phage tail X protein n=3 Tax=Azotobacter group TaxID=351 RepID=C1DP23_AZOVD|nr:Phage tail X protein [Azotobacter vinelandii DJ]AGK16409.1 Phage tail X protein [Azotobacter vinelandii CA]AGK21170.1 Phage tail X protein [Azotobacter vinelandii CA6]
MRTTDGDILDTLCHRHYGHLNGTLEAVLEANPGLADIPQPYSSGVLILLPDLQVANAETVRLWS